MNTRTTTAAAVAALVLLTASGCAITRGQESAGAYVDDTAITSSVKARYVDNKDVDASSIRVETLKGTVMRLLNERYANGHVDLLDGIKVFEERGWIQVLPDPDEPVVHLYAEGRNEEESRELEGELRAIVEEILAAEESPVGA